MVEKKVEIYSTPTWPACKGTKEFLSAKGIGYTEYDVSQDKEAMERLGQLTGGRRAVPVIAINGEVVIGFDRGKLERLLGLWEDEKNTVSWLWPGVGNKHYCQARGAV